MTPGQAAYEEWNARTPAPNFTWDEIPAEARNTWHNIADVVIVQYRASNVVVEYDMSYVDWID